MEVSVSAKELIRILTEYERVEKSVISDNFDRIFQTRYESKNQKGSKRTKIIGRITGSKDDTVMAWTNSSRPARIPLLKLLQVADAFDIPYEYLLMDNGTWLNDETRKKLRNRIIELEGECIDD